MVGWIWWSLPLFVFGALIAAWPERRRAPRRRGRAPPGAGQGPSRRSRGVRRRGLSIGLSLAAVTAVLLFVLAKGFGTIRTRCPSMLRGKPAPDFTLKRLDTGAPVEAARTSRASRSSSTSGRRWCGPCKMEHPVSPGRAKRFGQEVAVLGVVFEDTEENARRFAGSPDPSFPQLFDERSRMAVDYGVTGVPETYFIDAQGIIRDKVAAPIDPTTLMEKLAALKQPPGRCSEVVR